MGVKLMTGATGEQNIQAADDRECLAGITGLDSYVFPTAGKLAASMTDSNTLVIGTGAGSLQGARFRCATSTSLTIESGTQAQYRRDIAGLRFSRSAAGKESLAFEVLTGTPASTEAGAADPAYETGDLLSGDAEAFMPLYRVKLSGINVSAPEAMFSVIVPLSTLGDSVSRKTSRIVTGTMLINVTSVDGAHSVGQISGDAIKKIAGIDWDAEKMNMVCSNGDAVAQPYVYSICCAWNGGAMDVRLLTSAATAGTMRLNYTILADG